MKYLIVLLLFVTSVSYAYDYEILGIMTDKKDPKIQHVEILCEGQVYKFIVKTDDLDNKEMHKQVAEFVARKCFR
jgi:hypothetical protein